MASPSQRKITKTQQRPQSRGNLWIWVGLILVIALVAALLIYQAQPQNRFVLVSGDQEILVLLRNEKTGNYRLRYIGREPVDLNSIRVMLAGQVLHVDVKPVVLIKDGQEFRAQPDGSLPTGTALRLEPNDEIEVQVTYLGQTLGGNYLYGFQIGYNQGERERTEDLELGYEYEVIVE